MPDISVNIVTWNSIKDIQSCLEALNAQEYKDFQLIVIDNGSQDGSAEFVEQFYPNAKVIRNAKNEGFCRPHNQAIKLSDTDFVLPLNPDVVLSPGYIQNLVSAMVNDENAGIAVGKFYLPGGNMLDGAGLSIEKTRRQYLRGNLEEDEGQFDEQEYVFGADGGAPMYRRTMLKDIMIEGEYFDEDFFAHKEDLDLSWRAQLYGWKCIYVPTAIAFHDRSFRPGARGKISADVKMHAVKNRYLTILKNDIPGLFLRHLPYILWYDLKILGYLVLFEKTSLRVANLFIKILPKTWHKRRLIMERRRVSSQYMKQFFR